MRLDVEARQLMADVERRIAVMDLHANPEFNDDDDDDEDDWELEEAA